MNSEPTSTVLYDIIQNYNIYMRNIKFANKLNEQSK